MMRSLPYLSSFVTFAIAGAVACGGDAPPQSNPAGLDGRERAADASDERDEEEDDDDVDGGTTGPDGGRKQDAGKKDAATTDSGDDDDDGGVTSPPPTFTDVYANVISGTCTGCHGNTHGTGLGMKTQALAYANLVGKKAGAGGAGACNDGQRTRVVAGDPSASLLMKKLSHTQDCGGGMPLGGQKLPQAKIDLVEAWIALGAKND